MVPFFLLSSEARAVFSSNMRKKLFWAFLCLVVMECCLVATLEGMVQEKAEAINPIPTLSPPEGNTTFLGGTTWCVALAGASQFDLQTALDWACGLGMADCGAIQPGGPCYNPDTLLSHASYAFNAYYQKNGNNDVACNFGGTAVLTKRDPSYGKCAYATSESLKSSANPSFKHKPQNGLLLKLAIILLLLFMGS